MFGLFSNKRSSIKVTDKIWLNSLAKYSACEEMARINPDLIFLAWFEDTVKSIQGVKPSLNILLTQQTSPEMLQGKMIAFVEHHPMAKVEQAFFGKLETREIPVLSAMDEPIFQHFGGERLMKLMERLGLDDNEILDHSMITKALARAQGKLEEKVTHEKKAVSQKEWFALNISESKLR